nr:G protein-coupled receptor [Proales similis]
MQQHAIAYSLSTAIYALLAVFGFAGNLLAIASILSSSKLRFRSTYLLILNQSLAELFISVTVNISPLLGVLSGKNLLLESSLICKSFAAACAITCSASLISMGFLALNRYLAMTRPDTFVRLFSPAKTLLICILTWILAVMSDVPNFIGFGDHVYDQAANLCIFNRSNRRFTVFFAVVSFVIPGIGITVCYAQIYRLIYSSRKQLKVHNRICRNTVRLTRCLSATFVAFILCWAPIIVLIELDHFVGISPVLINYGFLLAHSNPALNPLLYFAFNSNLRDACQSLIRQSFTSSTS